VDSSVERVFVVLCEERSTLVRILREIGSHGGGLGARRRAGEVGDRVVCACCGGLIPTGRSSLFLFLCFLEDPVAVEYGLL